MVSQFSRARVYQLLHRHGRSQLSPDPLARVLSPLRDPLLASEDFGAAGTPEHERSDLESSSGSYGSISSDGYVLDLTAPLALQGEGGLVASASTPRSAGERVQTTPPFLRGEKLEESETDDGIIATPGDRSANPSRRSSPSETPSVRSLNSSRRSSLPDSGSPQSQLRPRRRSLATAGDRIASQPKVKMTSCSDNNASQPNALKRASSSSSNGEPKAPKRASSSSNGEQHSEQTAMSTDSPMLPHVRRSANKAERRVVDDNLEAGFLGHAVAASGEWIYPEKVARAAKEHADLLDP
eukprot:g62330.t1